MGIYVPKLKNIVVEGHDQLQNFNIVNKIFYRTEKYYYICVQITSIKLSKPERATRQLPTILWDKTITKDIEIKLYESTLLIYDSEL